MCIYIYIDASFVVDYIGRMFCTCVVEIPYSFYDLICARTSKYIWVPKKILIRLPLLIFTKVFANQILLMVQGVVPDVRQPLHTSSTVHFGPGSLFTKLQWLGLTLTARSSLPRIFFIG